MHLTRNATTILDKWELSLQSSAPPFRLADCTVSICSIRQNLVCRTAANRKYGIYAACGDFPQYRSDLLLRDVLQDISANYQIHPRGGEFVEARDCRIKVMELNSSAFKFLYLSVPSAAVIQNAPWVPGLDQLFEQAKYVVIT